MSGFFRIRPRAVPGVDEGQAPSGGHGGHGRHLPDLVCYFSRQSRKGLLIVAVRRKPVDSPPPLFATCLRSCDNVYGSLSGTAGRIPPKTCEKGQTSRVAIIAVMRKPGSRRTHRAANGAAGRNAVWLSPETGPGKSPGWKKRFSLSGGPQRRFSAGLVACGQPCG